MYAELIERLRANAEDYTGELQCEAADALAALAAEVEGLTPKVHLITDNLNEGRWSLVLHFGRNCDDMRAYADALRAALMKGQSTDAG